FALGLPGRTGGVKDEEWVLCAHFLAGAIGGHCLGNVIVIDVAAGFHVDTGVGAFDDNDAFDSADFLAGCVDVCFQRNLATAANAFFPANNSGSFAFFPPSCTTFLP